MSEALQAAPEAGACAALAAPRYELLPIKGMREAARGCRRGRR
ncbi:MAG: hypothetical protein U5L11_10835 [Arhodomonas sp.]|nr:hypothetical protein [Arhodomonas sp.]